MMHISARQARQRFAELLESAQAGRTIQITRRGKPVACLSPVRPAPAKPLPDMTAFHRQLTIQGQPMSQTIVQLRQQERY